ncbi:hypothetical protein ABG067_007454 [Albugo candida]|uniref:Uncharacterized protein n=1 Tax=Albugo candida TaxID=65357 RepID=A0A024FY72_9STRA|nr:unnamed protein product [Albugo candida]|eukprot:CCI11609.1 unnamed protein product [Albugo candida]
MTPTDTTHPVLGAKRNSCFSGLGSHVVFMGSRYEKEESNLALRWAQTMRMISHIYISIIDARVYVHLMDIIITKLRVDEIEKAIDISLSGRRHHDGKFSNRQDYHIYRANGS